MLPLKGNIPATTKAERQALSNDNNNIAGKAYLEKQTTTWNFELLDAEDEYWKCLI